MKALQVVLVSSALAFFASQAAAKVVFKNPEFSGSGCQNVSVAGAETHNMRIEFSSLNSIPSNNTCTITVPIQVPKGYQTSVMSAAWIGYAKGSTQLSYSFSGPFSASKSISLPLPSSNFIKKDSFNYSSYSTKERLIKMSLNITLSAAAPSSKIQINQVTLNNKIVIMNQF